MIKILYLILFYLIFRITDLVLLLVMLTQIVLNIFSGEPSNSVKTFGKSLGAYLQQISEFLSYASEDKPFPFSDWPEVGSVQIDPIDSVSVDAQAEKHAETEKSNKLSKTNDSTTTTTKTITRKNK